MPFLGLRDVMSHRAPSNVDYHQFKKIRSRAFPAARMQPEPVLIEGVREIEPLHATSLRAIVPERFTNAFFGPYVKF